MAIIKPIFRIFDYDKAIDFYVHWLGFAVDWEHVFEQGAPKYLQVSRGDIILHLSEHHGDGSPGVHLHIDGFKGLREYHSELIVKNINTTVPAWKCLFGMKRLLL